MTTLTLSQNKPEFKDEPEAITTQEIDNLKHENRKLNDRTYSLEIDVQRARETARYYQMESERIRNLWRALVHERAELLGTIARLTRELETIKDQAEAVQI